MISIMPDKLAYLHHHKSKKRKSGKKAAARHRRSWLRRMPRWAWWLTALIVVGGYVFIFYYFFVGPSGFRWRAIYGEPDYPEGYDIHGIDISHHQGVINWDKLRTAMINRGPVRFVMIKATEGGDYLDKCFRDNFYQARENGFIRGAYHFWSNKNGAREQAYFFLDQVKLEEGDLPPVLDVENKPADVSDEDFQRDILTWLHIVEDRYHVKPIIYTYYKFKEKYLGDERFDDYPFWIAHYYVKELEYTGKWKFWQHTDVGKLPGIETNVDLDVYNGSYYDLRMLTIGSGENEEVEVNTPPHP